MIQIDYLNNLLVLKLIKGIGMHCIVCSVFYLFSILNNIAILTQFKIKALVAVVLGRYQWTSSAHIASGVFKNSTRMCEYLQSMFAIMPWHFIKLPELKIEKATLA